MECPWSPDDFLLRVCLLWGLSRPTVWGRPRGHLCPGPVLAFGMRLRGRTAWTQSGTAGGFSVPRFPCYSMDVFFQVTGLISLSFPLVCISWLFSLWKPWGLITSEVIKF